MTNVSMLIILPAILLFLMIFVFQQNTQAIKNEQFLMNCPMPINQGVATLHTIVDGVRLNYTITQSGTQYNSKNYNGTFFECRIDQITKQPSANTLIKNYGAVLEFFGSAVLPYGQFAYFADSITSFLDGIQPTLTMIYLMFIAPSQISGLAWFTYAQLFLIFMIGLGIFMVIRG